MGFWSKLATFGALASIPLSFGATAPIAGAVGAGGGFLSFLKSNAGNIGKAAGAVGGFFGGLGEGMAGERMNKTDFSLALQAHLVNQAVHSFDASYKSKLFEQGEDKRHTANLFRAGMIEGSKDIKLQNVPTRMPYPHVEGGPRPSDISPERRSQIIASLTGPKITPPVMREVAPPQYAEAGGGEAALSLLGALGKAGETVFSKDKEDEETTPPQRA